jgi:23S rRNA (cytosine1962-C5)-methyltransferase
VIDQYDEYLVLQSGSLGIDLLKERIVDYLAAKKRWKGIYEKSSGASRKEEKLQDNIGVLWGQEKEDITILENGFSFKVYWKKGQKTGFFLDQREMRSAIKELSHNKTVLNVFSYTGGFSVYAMAGGAKSVDSLDNSLQATDWAKQNFQLNGFAEGRSRFLAQDAFSFLSKEPLDYDLIILDPPAFAKKKHDITQASKGYREINYQTLSKMPKGSILLTCSCSYYVDEELFQTLIFQAAKMANRSVQIIGKHLLAKDHPINLFHPESHYLKSLLLYVD